MEFKTYLNRDGYLKQKTILVHGPVAPGTLLSSVPIVGGIDMRHGMIVAVHAHQVDVVWNSYRHVDDIKYGDLRKRLGIPMPAEARRLKREADKARWAARKVQKEKEAGQ